MTTYPGSIGLDRFDDAPYGAYAVNVAQTIWYWNLAAERITGHKAWDVIGHPCFRVIQNLASHEDTPVCHGGCPSLKATSEGKIPRVYGVWMLCASGQRKPMILTPLVISAAEASDAVLVHLFHNAGDRIGAKQTAGTVDNMKTEGVLQNEIPEENKQITPRELEVLQLIAMGMAPTEIAGALHISYHTVRNHATNLRRKLGARNNLIMVRNARRAGLI